MDIAKLPYRPCVGIMLINRNRQVFVARRIDMQIGEAWQMPQGGIDKGEEPRGAALRELEEEVGTRRAEIVGECEEWLNYDLPAELVPKVWGGKFRGQTQKWFAMKFLGEDKDINIQTDHPEFSEWKWVNPVELPGIIVPFKRDIYARLVDEFRLHLY